MHAFKSFIWKIYLAVSYVFLYVGPKPIFNCSVNMSYSSICNYYPRMFESKFLMGALAAAMSETNILGYLADYPIYGMIANINAFAESFGELLLFCILLVFLCERRRRVSDMLPTASDDTD